MLVSYWHREGMEVYRVKGPEVERVASGSIEAITFTGSGKKVLIVARQMLLHARRRYPPTTLEN
jgi:hypothetical protein